MKTKRFILLVFVILLLSTFVSCKKKCIWKTVRKLCKNCCYEGI